MLVQVPQITKQQVAELAKIWKYKGLIVALDDAAIQFATDISNDVLRSLITTLAHQSQQAQAQAGQSVQSAQAQQQSAQEYVQANQGQLPQTLIVEG
jgi:ornithine carbamoyltransferase